jgi:hypothetical protein
VSNHFRHSGTSRAGCGWAQDRRKHFCTLFWGIP